jgi:hypothetical protein
MQSHYGYIGTDPSLLGHTALGMIKNGVFQVQVDDLEHPWTFGWHETPPTDWKEDWEPE